MNLPYHLDYAEGIAGKQVQLVFIQVEMPSRLLVHLDTLLLGGLVVVGEEDLGVAGLLVVLLHPSFPADHVVPGEPVRISSFEEVMSGRIVDLGADTFSS